MSSIINTIKMVLSDKKVSIVIIALVIVARILQLFFFYNMNIDGMYQVLAMQNFTEGHGISTSQVLPADLSTIVYEPLIKWPPGYSLLLSLFYILSGHTYIIASLTLDILAAIVLIFTCRKILKLLDTPAYLTNLFTLFTGFFIYYFYFINSSDAIAITFFLLAIYFSLLILKKESFSWRIAGSLSICLFFCGLIKYLFIPLVFIIPVFLLVKSITDKNRNVRKAAVFSFAFLLITMAGILAWQKITGGAAAYISEPSRGFFPENLRDFHPALPSSILSSETANLALPASTHLLFFRILQCLHILFFFAALFLVLKRVMKQGFKNLDLTNSFFYISFFLLAGISLVLVILSLLVGKEENIPGHWWTYVEEPRYYGLIHVLVHIGVFVLYQFYRVRKARPLKYLIIVLIILLLPETLRGILFTAKRIYRVKEEEYSWQYEKAVQQYTGAIIQREKLAGETIAVTGSIYYFNYRAGIYNHVPVLLESNSINDLRSLNTTKPTLLLVLLHEDNMDYYERFLTDPGKKFAGYFGGFYFYIVHVNPH